MTNKSSFLLLFCVWLIGDSWYKIYILYLYIYIKYILTILTIFIVHSAKKFI